MPKYRVSTDDGHTLDDGQENIEFANDKAASEGAQRALADMAQDQLPNGQHLDMKVSVENEAEDVVYQASLTFNGETADDMKAKSAEAADDAKKAMN